MLSLIKAIGNFFGVEVKALDKDTRPQKADLTLERDNRCRPLAIKVIKFLASREDLDKYIGSSMSEKEMNDYFSNVAKEFMDSLDREGLLLSDYDYAFRIATQALDQMKIKITNAVSYQYDRATEYLWGVDDVDLFLEHRVVEEVLKKAYEEKQKSSVDN